MTTTEIDAEAIATLRAAERDAVADMVWARDRLVKVRAALMALHQVPSDLLPQPANRRGHPNPNPPPPDLLRKALAVAHRQVRAPVAATKPEPAVVELHPVAAPSVAVPSPLAVFVRSGIRARPDYVAARSAAFSDATEWEAS